MNVCLLTLEWPPHGCGIGTYMYNLARGLAGMGHRVLVLTHDREPAQAEGVRIVPVAIPQYPSSLWLRIQKWRMEPFHTWAERAYHRFTDLQKEERVDVIETAEYGAWGRHFHDVGVPVVVRCHCPTRRVLWTAEGTEDKRMPLWMWIQDRRERSAAWRADGLASPSQALADRLSDCWAIPGNRFRVIPNPIDDHLFSPSQTVKEESNEVLYVGRLEHMKGVYDLMEAIGPLLELYPDVRVRFVGMDMMPPESLRAYGNLASEVIRAKLSARLNDRLIFTGHVPVDQIVEYWRKALCAVMPTRGFESFSYTVVEAMACGCPVVATRCGGPSEIITDGADGLLVTAGDIPAIRGAVIRLIEDRPMRGKLGLQARETVVAKYGISAVIPAIVSYYEQVVAGCRTARAR